MVRLLCVDDDPLARCYLATRLDLEPDIQVVGQVDSAAAACAYLRAADVDLILLDYELSGTDGLQLLQAISLWYENLPDGGKRPAVVFCTGYADSEFQVKARALGADGVVAKERAATELIPAVRTVAGGGCWFDHGLSSDREQKPERHKVLVAAQVRAERAIMTEQLLDLGCIVAHAWRCDEIIPLMNREGFDLLVMDQCLPGRPFGTEVLQQVADDWPSLPVILLTAHPEELEDYRPTPNVRCVIARPIRAPRFQAEIVRVLKARSRNLDPAVADLYGALRRPG